MPDRLLSDTSRDLIAIVGLLLAVMQILVPFVQLWRSRRAPRATADTSSQTRGFHRLFAIVYDRGIHLALALIAAGLLLNLTVSTAMHRKGLSVTTVTGAAWFDARYLWDPDFLWNNPVFILFFPGSILEGFGVPALFTSLVKASASRGRRLATVFAVLCACVGVTYVILIIHAVHSTHTEWIDLVIMSQMYSIVWIGLGSMIVIAWELDPDNRAVPTG